MDAQGRSWRSGALVEKRKLRQWFLKVTHFGSELVDGLDTLPDWPERVKALQRAWIGRSQGLIIQFPLESSTESLPVFTTKPDSLPGVSFIAVGPDHPLVSTAITTAIHNGDHSLATGLQELVDKCASIGFQEEEEADAFLASRTGLYAVHPISGAKVRQLPSF